MKYKNSEIEEYLNMNYQMSLKSIIIGLLVLIDSLGLPAIYLVNVAYGNKPFISITSIIIIPITILLNIWGIVIVAKKLNLQFLLFSGILCVTISILHFRLFYLVLYEVIKVSSKLYLYTALAIYLLIIICWFSWLKYALNKGYFNGRKRINKANYFIIASSAFLGLFGFKIADSIGGKTTKQILVALCFLILSYITIFVSHNFYKYYLIKKIKADTQNK